MLSRLSYGCVMDGLCLLIGGRKKFKCRIEICNRVAGAMFLNRLGCCFIQLKYLGRGFFEQK